MIARIQPGTIAGGEISLPASKSLSHRAILAASLSNGVSVLHHPGTNKDILATRSAMEHFGVRFEERREDLYVYGVERLQYDGEAIDCNESGSTLRFLIPIAALQDKTVIFTGRGRLMERPQTVYKQLFHERGMRFEKAGNLLYVGGGLQGGEFKARGDISSQFFTGLLYALPLTERDSTLTILPPFESESYVNLTMDVLHRAGIRIHRQGLVYSIQGGQHYEPIDYAVSGDDSQMAFFASLACIAGVPITVHHVDHASHQCDHIIPDIIRNFGGVVEEVEDGYRFMGDRLHGIHVDLADCPDLGPVLFALATQVEGETVFTHCERLRIKESDRIACMEEELHKLGCDIHSDGGTVIVKGKTDIRGGVKLDGHNDHRIVMALSVLCAVCEKPVEICGAEAIEKSYPAFFEDLKQCGVQVDYVEG